jgi:enediyne biosynthesis protein E4
MAAADAITPPAPDAVEPSGRSRVRWWIAGFVALSIVAVGVIVLVTQGTGRSETAAGADAPHFVDDTATSGITHSYDGGFDFFVGGGVAAFDCDDDGSPDLYFAGGSSPAALYRNESPTGGALGFEQVTSAVTDLVGVTGAYPIDIDSDGHLDLVVLRHGGNAVLRGLGDCAFEPATDELGVDAGDDWTTAFSASWEGANALPTMAFGTYLLADGETCGDSMLARPDEPSAALYGPPIALEPGYCTLSMLFSDWSRTGQRDLRLANDRHYYTDGSEQLWHISPESEPRSYTEADGWLPLQLWGMGLASRDLTGDGYPEVFITSQGDNKLQTLDDLRAAPTAPTYRDIALRRGATAQRPYAGGDVLPSTAWHPEFEDVNNDSRVDLFVSKGNVEGQTDHAMRDPNNLLIAQPDGTFVEGAETAGIVGYQRSRGAAVVDLNLDGLLDLVVVHREEVPSLWRNVGAGDADRSAPMGHWLAVDLDQPAPNVDAVGAWLEARTDDGTIEREVTVGGGHAGGKAGWIHVGLGDADSAEVRVTWPDGEVGPWIAVDADQFVTVSRDGAVAEPWQPPGG